MTVDEYFEHHSEWQEDADVLLELIKRFYDGSKFIDYLKTCAPEEGLYRLDDAQKKEVYAAVNQSIQNDCYKLAGSAIKKTFKYRLFQHNEYQDVIVHCKDSRFSQ